MHYNHWAARAVNLTNYSYGNNEKVEGGYTLRGLDFVFMLLNEEFPTLKPEGNFSCSVNLACQLGTQATLPI